MGRCPRHLSGRLGDSNYSITLRASSPNGLTEPAYPIHGLEIAKDHRWVFERCPLFADVQVML